MVFCLSLGNLCAVVCQARITSNPATLQRSVASHVHEITGTYSRCKHLLYFKVRLSSVREKLLLLAPHERSLHACTMLVHSTMYIPRTRYEVPSTCMYLCTCNKYQLRGTKYLLLRSNYGLLPCRSMFGHICVQGTIFAVKYYLQLPFGRAVP